MYFTNPNKCIFKIDYALDTRRELNDNVWGHVFYEDGNVSLVKKTYESYVWKRLLHDTPKHRFKGMTAYNPYTSREYDFGDESGLFANKESNDDEDRENFFSQIDVYLTETLQTLLAYKKFIVIAYETMKREGFVFEPFQKSIIYEHLFYYIAEHSSIDLLKIFVFAMHDYFGFTAISVDNVICMYTKKQYVGIIPRRHGKTVIIYAVIAAFLLAVRNVTVLAVAQTKNIIMTTKKKILAYIEYWLNKPEFAGLMDIKLPTTDNVQITFRDTADTSLLICVSAHLDNSLRGPDPQICIVDEMMCINQNRFNTILALNQKKMCKVGFLSSPTPESKELLIQFITRLTTEKSGTNFYHVGYFCGANSHSKYSTTQDGCVNLLFYKPRHIVFTEANKTLTEIMTSSTACYDGELGIIREEELDAYHNGRDCSTTSALTRTFNDSFYEYLKTTKFVSYHLTHETTGECNFFLYLDPAYCATKQSGIGMACTAFISKKNPVLFYLNHEFMSPDNLLYTHKKIIVMILDCVSYVTSVVKRVCGNKKMINFFIAIENNNNQSSVATLYNTLEKQFLMLPNTHRMFLYRTESKMVDENKCCKSFDLLPGYALTNTKRYIMEEVLNACNAKHFKVSAHLPDTKVENEFPINYLVKQCKTFKWCAIKRTHTGKSRNSSDDLVIAFIMSIYLATRFGDHVEDFITSFRLPWCRRVK